MSHGLKKGFIGMMWMVCAAVISACSPSPAAEPAVLPPEEQVRTVSVERDGVASDCGNREQIGELLSILGGAWNQRTCSPCRIFLSRMNIHPFILKI